MKYAKQQKKELLIKAAFIFALQYETLNLRVCAYLGGNVVIVWLLISFP